MYLTPAPLFSMFITMEIKFWSWNNKKGAEKNLSSFFFVL
jgi:hypothetical protein